MNLIEELEMWAERDPVNTSVPFGKLFKRASTAIRVYRSDAAKLQHDLDDLTQEVASLRSFLVVANETSQQSLDDVERLSAEVTRKNE